MNHVNQMKCFLQQFGFYKILLSEGLFASVTVANPIQGTNDSTNAETNVRNFLRIRWEHPRQKVPTHEK